MDRFCPRADCKGGGGGAEDVAEDAAGGRAFAFALTGNAFGIGPAEEDAAVDVAEEVCNGKRDCTDCSDRWDPCDWWGFLAAAFAVRFKRSAMSRTTWSGMSRKKDMNAFQDSSS